MPVDNGSTVALPSSEPFVALHTLGRVEISVSISREQLHAVDVPVNERPVVHRTTVVAGAAGGGGPHR